MRKPLLALRAIQSRFLLLIVQTLLLQGSSQRGLCLYTCICSICLHHRSGACYTMCCIYAYMCLYYIESSYPCGSIAVLLIYTCMRYICFDSYTNDSLVKDQLGSYAHALYAQPLGIRFYIREDWISLALIVDPLLVLRPREDVIA